jgi:phosphatidylglycerol---prolipoprotein diacylglyceryl transferase
MIPYFQLTTLSLGPVTIQVWGLMVAAGILVGAKAAAMMADKRGLKSQVVWDLATWVIVGAFVGARLVYAVYEPLVFLNDPVEFIRIWHGGFSVMGGFLGALFVGIAYLRHKQLDVHAYADVGVFGLPLGLFIGRIGCFLIHDHPGTFTDFIGGVQYPDGVRHDHGLYLSLNGLALFLVFLALARRGAKQGTYIIVFLLWYGIVRFFLDFLRATNGGIVDTRYLSLTPAQYFSVAMVVGGLYLFVIKPKKI